MNLVTASMLLYDGLEIVFTLGLQQSYKKSKKCCVLDIIDIYLHFNFNESKQNAISLLTISVYCWLNVTIRLLVFSCWPLFIKGSYFY